MVIHTTVILAILLDEPAARPTTLALARSEQRLISAATMIETNVVIISRGIPRGFGNLIGRGCPKARLNSGDCFTYALAKETGQPLLFKGNVLPHRSRTVPYEG